MAIAFPMAKNAQSISTPLNYAFTLIHVTGVLAAEIGLLLTSVSLPSTFILLNDVVFI